MQIKRFTTTLAVNAMFLFGAAGAALAQQRPPSGRVQIDPRDIGFQIPDFADLLSFAIKFMFVIAGLLALFYLMWGALSWVTSGGDKDAVGKARGKIIAALVGVILIVAVLGIVSALENIVFKRTICFGITCPIQLPNLLEPVGP